MAEEVKVQGGGKGTAVDLTKRQTVYATASHPYRAAGEEIKVSPKLAEDALNRGFAAKTKAEAEKTAAKTGDAPAK